MQKYLGVKLLEAKPMTRGEYNEYRGWQIPENENPADKGFLVVYADGYESWSPEKQFNEAHRLITNLTYGLALEAAQKGYKIARTGWNGKGMFVVHVAEGFLSVQGAVYPLRPYLAIRNVDHQFCPWLASQTDMLAEDWVVVE